MVGQKVSKKILHLDAPVDRTSTRETRLLFIDGTGLPWGVEISSALIKRCT